MFGWLMVKNYSPLLVCFMMTFGVERWSRSSSLWKSNLNFDNFILFIHRFIQYLNLDVVKSRTIFDLEKVITGGLENASTRKENGFNRRKRKFTSQHWNKKKGSKQKIDVSTLNFLESLKSLLFHEWSCYPKSFLTWRMFTVILDLVSFISIVCIKFM